MLSHNMAPPCPDSLMQKHVFVPAHVYHCSRCGQLVETSDTLDFEFGGDGKPIYIRRCSACSGALCAGYPPSRVSDLRGHGRQFETTHWSDSLAIAPSQVEAHQRLFPEIRVRPDGVVGFDSVKQQDEYLNKTGFVKQTQKTRGLKS